MSEKKLISTEIVGTVKIFTYDDGSWHFEPLPQEQQPDCRSWWQKVKDWLNGSPVTPYAKIRDCSDPFDDKHYDGGTKEAVEVGIKVDF